MPTPHTAFRLDEETKASLRRTAEQMDVSMTEAASRAIHAMRGLAIAMQATTPRMCPLGYGHTEHIWEMTGKPPIEAGIYRCAGQPFSNGYDPVDF